MAEWPGGPRLFEHLRNLSGALRVPDMEDYVRSLGFSSEPLPAKTFQGTPYPDAASGGGRRPDISLRPRTGRVAPLLPKRVGENSKVLGYRPHPPGAQAAAPPSLARSPGKSVYPVLITRADHHGSASGSKAHPLTGRQETRLMKIVVLDGYTLNPGDLSWEGLEALGELTVYDHSLDEQAVERRSS